MMMQAHAIATGPSAAGGHDHRSTSSPLAGGVVAATQALGKRKHAVEDCASPRKCLALPAPGTLQNTVHAKHRTADCTLTHHHQESAHSAPSQDRRRRSSSSGDEPSSATALDCDLLQRPSITTANAANAANAAATAAAAAALDPPTMADSCLSTRSDAAGPGPSAGARDRAGAAAGGGGSAGVAARAATAAAGDAPCPAVGGCTDDDVAQRRLERMEVVVEELVGQVHQLQRELREQREVGQQMARALHSANTASASGEATSGRGMSTPGAAPTSPTRRQQGQEGQHSAWVEGQLRAAAEECVASVKSQLRAFAERAISGLQQQVQAQCGAASKYVTSASTLCERLEGVRMAAEQQCAALQGYVAEITGAVRSGSGNVPAAASRASPATGARVGPGSAHSSPTASKAGAQLKPASPGRTSPSGASAHKAAAATAVNPSAAAPSSTTAAARSHSAAAASAAAPGFNSSAQAARPAPGATGASAGPKPSSPVPQASARPHTPSALTSATLASAPQASHVPTYSNAASLSPVLPLFTASAVPGMHGASASSLSVGMGDTYQLSDGALLLLARVALGAPAPVNV